jgi:hypothetical protein
VNSLAEDVTLEGSAMNGVAHGAEAVRSIMPFIRTLYDDQEFNFAGPEECAQVVGGAQYARRPRSAR